MTRKQMEYVKRLKSVAHWANRASECRDDNSFANLSATLENLRVFERDNREVLNSCGIK